MVNSVLRKRLSGLAIEVQSRVKRLRHIADVMSHRSKIKKRKLHLFRIVFQSGFLQSVDCLSMKLLNSPGSSSVLNNVARARAIAISSVGLRRIHFLYSSEVYRQLCGIKLKLFTVVF